MVCLACLPAASTPPRCPTLRLPDRHAPGQNGFRVFPSPLQAQEGQLSEQEAASIIKCVLEFLADCHERSICYGDVKPNNFVLRSLYPCIAHLMDPRKPRGNLEVVAVDFGCCQEVDRENCLPDTKVREGPCLCGLARVQTVMCVTLTGAAACCVMTGA